MRDDLIETAIEIVRELRKQVGCTPVSLSADLEDPSVLHLFQTWESQDSLMANLGLPQIEAIRDHVGRLGLREMTILKYEIASVGTIA